jgi:signal peptidase II
MRTSGVIAALLVALDQLTKHWAVNALDDRIIDVVGSLRFNLAFNSGMAFGRGQGFGPIIGVLALVVIVGLLVSLRTGAGRVGTLAVGLVVGGALGNIIDRLFRGDGWFRGAVVDFIDLQWWPVFNVADMGVTIGGVLLVLGTVIGERREAAPGDRTPQPDASETAG